MLMSLNAYADVITDSPIDISASPFEETAAAAPSGQDTGISGGFIDISNVGNLPEASFNAPSQETSTEAEAAPGVLQETAEETAPAVLESAAPSENMTVTSDASEAPQPAKAETAAANSDSEYSAPVQYVTVGGSVSGTMTGPSMISSGSSDMQSAQGPSPSASSSASGSGQPGSRYASDAMSRLDLGYTLVSPNVEFNGFKVAEGSAQLSDGSWEAVSKSQYIRNRYYKLISEQTDSSGTGWYVVAAGGRQVGNYRTSDGSVLSEIWLKKSDCTAQSYIDLNTSNSTRQQIVRNALSYLGKRYQFAANGPDAFDCSGFVNYIMNSVGISVPRSSSEICTIGTQVSADELRPGDIVGRPGHVGIYIGDGWFVHASESSTGVITESLEVYSRTNRFTNFINVVGD